MTRAPSDHIFRAILMVLLFALCTPALYAGPDATKKGEKKQFGQQPQTFEEQLKERYLRLRNTDPALTKIDAWRLLAEQMSSATSRGIGGASMLYNLSIVYEKLGDHDLAEDRENGEVEYAKSKEALTRLVQKYVSHPLADDALMRVAEIAIKQDDEDEAVQVWKRIVKEYPDGDMAVAARFKISGEAQPKVIQVEKPSPQSSKVIDKRDDAPLVVIDPGHGGEDFGAVGVGGLMEKDVTLAVSLELKKILETRYGYRVEMTRDSDRFAPLADRTQLANDLKAALFVSVHANASLNKKQQGFEIYYLDTTDDSASVKLAARENAAGGDVGDLDFILSDLVQNSKLAESISAAHAIERALMSQVTARDRKLVTRGVHKGPFFVLVGAHMPCVLAELFFIDNQKEGTLLADRSFRADLAEGLAFGIHDVLSANK